MFKGLTARHLYKSVGVKGLIFSANQEISHIYGNRDVIHVIKRASVMSRMEQVRTPSLLSLTSFAHPRTGLPSDFFPQVFLPQTFIHSFLSNVSTRPAPTLASYLTVLQLRGL
jgi:hypothetical protein